MRITSLLVGLKFRSVDWIIWNWSYWVKIKKMIGNVGLRLTWIIYKTIDWIITQFYQTRMNNLHHYRMSYQCYRFCDFELSSSLSTREHAGSKNRCQKLSRWCKKIINVIQKSEHHRYNFHIKSCRIKSFRWSLLVEKSVPLAFRPCENDISWFYQTSKTTQIATHLLIKDCQFPYSWILMFNQYKQPIDDIRKQWHRIKWTKNRMIQTLSENKNIEHLIMTILSLSYRYAIMSNETSKTCRIQCLWFIQKVSNFVFYECLIKSCNR